MAESRESPRCEPERWIWLQHRLSFFADSHCAGSVDLLVQTSTTRYIRFPVCVTSPQLVPDADGGGPVCVAPQCFSCAVMIFDVLHFFSYSDPATKGNELVYADSNSDFAV